MKRTNESGRSMVEMLGVLAIIGVLSIGGIAGYTVAMNRYRANEVLDIANKYALYVFTARETYKTMHNGTLNTGTGENGAPGAGDFIVPGLCTSGLWTDTAGGDACLVNGASLTVTNGHTTATANEPIQITIDFDATATEGADPDTQNAVCRAAASTLGVDAGDCPEIVFQPIQS